MGFGYPLWLIYAPLPYIVAEAFHLAGLGFTAAVKATWALGFLLGVLGIYRVAQRWWGSSAALVSSLVFTYAPYHLAQIYVRADLAEFMAWSWFPWAFLAVDTLWDDPRPRRLACAALALGTLLYLHTVSPLIFAPFLAAFFLYRLASEKRLRPALWVSGAAALGVLSAVGIPRAGSRGAALPVAHGVAEPELRLLAALCLPEPVSQPLLGIWAFATGP